MEVIEMIENEFSKNKDNYLEEIKTLQDLNEKLQVMRKNLMNAKGDFEKFKKHLDDDKGFSQWVGDIWCWNNTDKEKEVRSLLEEDDKTIDELIRTINYLVNDGIPPIENFITITHHGVKRGNYGVLASGILTLKGPEERKKGFCEDGLVSWLGGGGTAILLTAAGIASFVGTPALGAAVLAIGGVILLVVEFVAVIIKAVATGERRKKELQDARDNLNKAKGVMKIQKETLKTIKQNLDYYGREIIDAGFKCGFISQSEAASENFKSLQLKITHNFEEMTKYYNAWESGCEKIKDYLEDDKDAVKELTKLRLDKVADRVKGKIERIGASTLEFTKKEIITISLCLYFFENNPNMEVVFLERKIQPILREDYDEKVIAKMVTIYLLTFREDLTIDDVTMRMKNSKGLQVLEHNQVEEIREYCKIEFKKAA